MHFPFTDAQIAAFRTPGAQVILGLSHPAYSHMAVLPEAVRAELSGDFSVTVTLSVKCWVVDAFDARQVSLLPGRLASSLAAVIDTASLRGRMMRDSNLMDKLNAPLVDRNAVVAVHLRHLAERVKQRRPRADDAIVASVSLRVLFEQGLIGRVAKDNGIDLKIEAPDLSAVPYTQAIIFACGGYEFSDKLFAPFYLYREPGPTSPFRPQFEEQVRNSPTEHRLIELSPHDFERSVSLAFAGKTWSRCDVFKFVAHKCGGAHALHEDDIAKFEEMHRHLANLGKMFSAAEIELSIVFCEVLGTAWFLMKSPAIGALQQRLSGYNSSVIEFLNRLGK